MKNVLMLDTFREIKHSVSRFLSIFTIIALGCGFFSGIKATMPDMVDTATDYFVENNLMDLKLVSTIGIKSEDVTAVRHADGVKGAMPGYSKDVFYNYNNRNVVLKVMSYNDSMDKNSDNYLNKPVLTEGRYPEKSGECVVEVKLSSPDTFKVGNTLKLSSAFDNEDIYDTFAEDTYEIVGIVTSPLYIGYERDATKAGNGTVQSYIMVPEEDFVCDYYSELYVAFDGLSGLDPFSDEYLDEVNKKKSSAVNAFETSVNNRFNQMKSEAEEDIDSAKQQAETLEELLKCDISALTLLEQTTQQSIKQLESQGTADTVTQFKLSQEKSKLEKITALLNARKLGDAVVEKEYKAQLDEINKQIKSSEQQLSLIENPQFYEFNRFSSADYSSFKGDSEKVDAVAKIFPVFFIIVAALVCLNTMTRMVEEQRIIIGTYKALGYSSFRIIMKYIIYASVAAVLGSIVGVLIGLQLFPYIIYDSYKILYNIPKINTPFRLNYLILCMLASVLCTCSAVVYSSVKSLNSQPSQLMRPKPPKSGRRVVLEKVDFIWNKLSFLGKVSVRNLLRYKKRFFMTIVGVAGCTALIVTGFGLKYSIKSIADKQFNEIFIYDAEVLLNSSKDLESSKQKLKDYDEIKSAMFFSQTDVTAINDNTSQNAGLIVPENPEEMKEYVNLKSANDDKAIEIDNNSVVITEKLAKMLDLKVGESINIEAQEKQTVSLKIGGIVKNYALHYIFISPELYEKAYGEIPRSNLSFLKIRSQTDNEAFKEKIISDNSFLGVTYKTDSSKGFLNSVDSLNAIVILLIFCAGFLAVIVLYNLANINITERVKEIATIKLLGFYDGETSSYIYRENIISALIGILIGEILGKVLHYFVVITTEVDVVMFNRELVWWAYALGALLTAVFAVSVNLVLHFKLKKIDMVESLKSIE